MPGKGIDFVLPSDYDKLVVARQQELAFIDEQLMVISRAGTQDARDFLTDLRLWIANRRACFQPGAET